MPTAQVAWDAPRSKQSAENDAGPKRRHESSGRVPHQWREQEDRGEAQTIVPLTVPPRGVAGPPCGRLGAARALYAHVSHARVRPYRAGAALTELVGGLAMCYGTRMAHRAQNRRFLFGHREAHGTLVTPLEDEPVEVGGKFHAARGWDPVNHLREGDHHEQT